MEGHGGSGALTGYGSRIKPGSVVVHRDTDEIRGWIDAIFQHQRSDTAGILHLRPNGHGLAGCRKHRTVADVEDGRADVRCQWSSAVARSGCAKVDGERHRSDGLQPVSMEAKQQFRVSAQPAHFGS